MANKMLNIMENNNAIIVKNIIKFIIFEFITHHNPIIVRKAFSLCTKKLKYVKSMPKYKTEEILTEIEFKRIIEKCYENKIDQR